MSSPPNSESPSPESSPRLSAPSQPTHDSGDDYFGDVIYESPESDNCDSELHQTEDEDTGTDSTLEDGEHHPQFGHPLERMPRLKSADHGLCYDSDAAVKVLLNSSYSSKSSLSLSDSVTINYDRIIDILLVQKPNPFILHGDGNFIMFDSPQDDTVYRHQESLPPVMVKRFKMQSPELRLLLELNIPESREDPWNIAPHILRTVEKDDYVYLCMQRLYQYNDPPLVSVAQYIDFFRQVLEGLSFLHEQHIAGLRCAEPVSYMVDLSSAPHRAPNHPSPMKDGDAPTLTGFDRFSFPVRYYFADFSEAARFSAFSPYPPSPGPSGSSQRRHGDPFKRDVQDCGAFFDRLLLEVPQIAPKFKSLTKAMTLGGFDADDARRLFEALCRSLDAEVFEKSVSPQPANTHPGRAHSLAYLALGSPRSPDNAQEKVISR